MEIPQTDWGLSFDEDLVGRSALPSYTSPWDLQTSIWSAPSSIPSALTGKPKTDIGGFASQDFVTMPVNTQTKDQDVQTENWTEEKGNNTNDDWHRHMRSIDDRSTLLAEQYETLVKQQASSQASHITRVGSLKRIRDEKTRQHQSLIDKIESLHVKLDLNSSKTTRKNFVLKLEELTAEKERMVDGQSRLTQELEEVESKLKMLVEEQSKEKLSWQKDMDDLQSEKERIIREVEEASQMALKDEMAALESQKEIAVSLVEDWIAEAERYLGTLRLDPSPQYDPQVLEWERNLNLVQTNLMGLQNKYDENHKLLQEGQQLDSLPTIPMPSLPNVPTIDLFMTPLINSIQSPYFSSAVLRASPTNSVALPLFPAHRFTVTPPTVVSKNMAMPPPTPSAHAPEQNSVMAMAQTPKTPHLIMPTAFPPRLYTHAPPRGLSLPRPLPHANAPPNLLPGHPNGYVTSPTHTSAVAAQVALPLAPSLVGLTASHASVQAALGLPQGAGPAAPLQKPLHSSSAAQSNPPPSGRLEQFLERLGIHFPECTRNQLMGVLQQIKSERGTMAGLSEHDITQQLAQRLAQGECLAPGPIGPRSGSRDFPAPIGPVQRPPGQPLPPVRPHVGTPNAQVFQPRASQQFVPSVRKLCLVCQNHVEAGTQYITNCPHTLHKECIRLWHQSSKNNSCPFCPSK